MTPTAIERLAIPLAILAFWCGMITAARAHPGGYDWQFQTISVLLYPDQNPRGYLWAWAGLELCGLGGFAWTVALRRLLAKASATPAATGLRVLQWGFFCMCCAVLSDRLLPWSKGHEALAILAFLGISIGVTRQMWAVGARSLSLLPLAPLLLAGATQSYLTLEQPNLPWVGPGWRARGISPFLSFGLWEWITCAVFSACLLVLWRRRLASRTTDA